jgi:integrase
MKTMYWYRQASDREMLAGAPPPPPALSPEEQIALACGLRRSELLDLRVGDIQRDEEGRLWIRVANRGRGNRKVPVLAELEQVILRLAENARLLPDISQSVSLQYARKEYARCLYDDLCRKSPLRLAADKINEEAVRAVMQALGHSDQAVVTRYYLGLREDPENSMATESTDIDTEPEPGLVDQQQ